ncbi:MAG: radical SAM protein [Desulfobacterales bacterium]|nr:MAG: radical SAM protein [Desulfobacterales bacterium]
MTFKKTVVFAKKSTNIFLHILTRCNLKCQHCYINPEQHGTDILPLATIKAWLAVFAAKHPGSNVIFLGGEPTLHPALPSAVKHARELGFASITVDTNGYLFHDILSKVAPADVDYFSFSLDGATPHTHDGIRGSGAYAACLAGIRKANARGFATSVIYTVSLRNIHELEMMGPLLKDLAINRLFIQVIGLRGRSAPREQAVNRNQAWQVSREEWLGVIPGVASQIARLGITVTYPKVFLDPEEIFECAGLAAANYFVFPNGRVYQCPLCEDFPIHSLVFEKNRLVPTAQLNENDFFKLKIPEGCVMNKLIQPQNLKYGDSGEPEYRIACCMLKEEIAV